MKIEFILLSTKSIGICKDKNTIKCAIFFYTTTSCILEAHMKKGRVLRGGGRLLKKGVSTGVID
jgi:hypothetical protein